MPKKAQSKTASKIKNIETAKSILKFGESYTSLVLGIIVIVIATVLLITFVKGKNISTKNEIAKQTQTEKITPALGKKVPSQNLLKKEQKNTTNYQAKAIVTPTDAVQANTAQKISGQTYTVTKGDTLWSIAEKKYNSGYNWVDIQKANNITNPDILFVGSKLTLPDVAPKIVTGTTIQTNKISGSSYTIAKGDTLWDIAVRAYGDGFAWTKIARANNLSNPGLIFSGNKLTIPRN